MLSASIEKDSLAKLSNLGSALRIAVSDEKLGEGFKLKEVRDEARRMIRALTPKGPSTNRLGQQNIPLADGWVTSALPNGAGFTVRHRSSNPRAVAILNSLNYGSAAWVLENPDVTVMSVLRAKARPRKTAARNSKGRFQKQNNLPLIADSRAPGRVVFFAQGSFDIPAREGSHFIEATVEYINERIQSLRASYISGLMDSL